MDSISVLPAADLSVAVDWLDWLSSCVAATPDSITFCCHPQRAKLTPIGD